MVSRLQVAAAEWHEYSSNGILDECNMMAVSACSAQKTHGTDMKHLPLWKQVRYLSYNFLMDFVSLGPGDL